MPEDYLVSNGVLMNVHDPSKCQGEWCCIHNWSRHHMVEWDQVWRDDRRLMERICPHGIGHPDPDDPSTDRLHGCDGCCDPEPVTIHELCECGRAIPCRHCESDER